MGSTAVAIRGVSKRFKKHHRRKRFLTLKSTMVRDLWRSREDEKDYFWALRDIDLEVKHGETIGFIGSNGSGKSTLLKIIAGILTPTSGTVSVNGRLSALIELGAGFHPEISGRENVFINGIMLGLTKQEINSKFDEIVDFAELWDFIDNPVRTYSSGMFMRLGFSVAVHVNPDILLIDEVLAVGDQSFVHKCLEKIFDFKRRNKTIIVVSHDLLAIEKLCSRVIWLSKGRREAIGAPQEVIGSYLMSITKKEQARYAEQHRQVVDAMEAPAETGPEEREEPEPESAEMDETASAAQENKEEPRRWGTREVEITRVRIFDTGGNERYVFNTGESLTIRIEYKTGKRIENPVFGIGFYLSDGTWCYGTNTDIEKIDIASISGEGWIDIVFRNMNFIENTYLVSVAVHALDETPYDYHNKLYKIAFRSGIHDAGIFRLEHEWRFSEGVSIGATERPGGAAERTGKSADTAAIAGNREATHG